MNRYVFIGSVEFSAHCLRALLEMRVNIVDILCPLAEVSSFNSDYCDLAEVVRDYGREVTYFRRIAEKADHLRNQDPDVIFVLGLSQIIPGKVLQIPTMGCVGSHPALLPQNRGRHPIIWALANGLQTTGVTLFWMDQGIDTGDIWLQRQFNIGESDDASTVYENVKRLSVDMLRQGIPELEKGLIRRVKQDDSKSNYWRQRTREDGAIDWRMSSKRIRDLIRALTRPYVGAHCVYKGREVKIWRADIVNEARKYAHLEPGKVLTMDGSHFQVKTGDGVVEVTIHDFDPLPKVGEYL